MGQGTMLRAVTAALICMAAATSDAAAKVPACTDTGKARTLVREPGQLESAAFDASGRLAYTNITRRQVRGLDAPGAVTRTIAAGIDAPGGMALLPDGDMLVGGGAGIGAMFAPRFGPARLLRVDLETGARSTFARGLSMANGVVRAPDGTVYASNDLANSLDRITADGKVQRGWFRRANTNGLALSADGRTLYANVTFGPTRVLAIDTETGLARTFARPPASRSWAALDDLDIDADGRLYAAAYLAGEVWRIDVDGAICALARGLRLPAGITVGPSAGAFAADSVFVTTHTGSIVEVQGAIPASG